MDVYEYSKRKEGTEVTEEDFDRYWVYVTDLHSKIKDSDVPDEEKILWMNRLFYKAKKNVMAADKLVYRPSKSDIRDILEVCSNSVDNLNSSIPNIRYVNFSVADLDDLGIDLSIQREGTILFLPPYFLVDTDEERLTVYEEVIHHALSEAPFSIISERKSSLLRLYEDLAEDAHEDYGLNNNLKKDLKELMERIREYGRCLDHKHPTRALIEGAPLFLSEKVVHEFDEGPDGGLVKSFEDYIKYLGKIPDYYSKFKLTGYEALKKIEENSPEQIRKLSSLKNDLDMYNLAGIDMDDLGVLSNFYKR